MIKELINKKVMVWYGINGNCERRGTITKTDDEYICLDNKLYISKKYIVSIDVI